MAQNSGNGNPFAKQPIKDNDGNLVNPFSEEYATEKVGPEHNKSRTRKGSAAKHPSANDRSATDRGANTRSKSFAIEAPQQAGRFINKGSRQNVINGHGGSCYKQAVKPAVTAYAGKNSGFNKPDTTTDLILSGTKSEPAVPGFDKNSLIVKTGITPATINANKRFGIAESGIASIVNGMSSYGTKNPDAANATTTQSQRNLNNNEAAINATIPMKKPDITTDMRFGNINSGFAPANTQIGTNSRRPNNTAIASSSSVQGNEIILNANRNQNQSNTSEFGTAVSSFPKQLHNGNTGARLATDLRTAGQKPGVLNRPRTKDVNDRLIVGYRRTVLEAQNAQAHVGKIYPISNSYNNSAMLHLETEDIQNDLQVSPYGSNNKMPQNDNFDNSPPKPNQLNQNYNNEEETIFDDAVDTQSPIHSENILAQTSDESSEEEEEQATDEDKEKHPLSDTWVWWYLKVGGVQDWSNLTRKIMQFDTIEDFWMTYKKFKTEVDMNISADFSVFKRGIRPIWEDPANSKGGRWIFRLSDISEEDLLQIWMKTLVFTVGSTSEYMDNICGVVLSVRKQSHKIAIWTNEIDNDSDILNLGHELKSNLELHKTELQYHLNENCKNSNGGRLSQPKLTIPVDEGIDVADEE